MASFFEKLIGVQNENKQTPEKNSAPIVPSRKEEIIPVKKTLKIKPVTKTEKRPILAKVEKSCPEPEPEPEKIKPQMKIQPEPELEPKPALQSESEGQLAIDVYQTDGYIIVQSAVGGIKPANLEVTIENGIVKIKGSRQKTETVKQDDYIINECYWGNFSRQFVLPAEVDASRAEAILKDGIITVKIPKINKERVMKLEIR